jgi:uncharacterized OsmC-like protein
MARDVTATWRLKSRVDVTIGSHALTVDEPLDRGGDDRGPTPVDLLLAALTS